MGFIFAGRNREKNTASDFVDRRKTAKDAYRVVLMTPSLIRIPYEHPRRSFDTTDMLELCASIAKYGMIHPLIVRISETGRYEVISGARRLRAAIMLGLEKIPCVVMEADVKTAKEICFEENNRRCEISPRAEAVTEDVTSKEVQNPVDAEAVPAIDRTCKDTDDEKEEEKRCGYNIYNKMKETDEKSWGNCKISVKNAGLILNSVKRLAGMAQRCGIRAEMETHGKGVQDADASDEWCVILRLMPESKADSAVSRDEDTPCDVSDD